MILHAIDFICRETALHLKRDRLIAIATISTVAVLLLVLGSVVLLLLDLRVWTGRATDQLTVRGYFSDETSRDDAMEATEPIAAWSEVRTVIFVTREDGWEEQKRKYPAIARLGNGIENPLSDAVEIKVREPEQSAAVAKRLEQLPGIEAVQWAGSLAESLVKLKLVVKWGGVVISLLVAIAGVFIVHNTIRLALHSRWREIYVMQLVGATRSVIVAPFLLEGMLHGLVGTAIACCILVPAHMYLRTLSARSAPFLVLIPDSDLLPFTLCLLLGAALLGVTGSAVAIRRYLSHKPQWHG